MGLSGARSMIVGGGIAGDVNHAVNDSNKKGRLAPAVHYALVGAAYSAAAGAGLRTETWTRPSDLRSNSTWPLTRAKMVWSRPSPTFAPGRHFVPRWRTMMLPASTLWPPDFLMPRRRPSVSRPLRDEPPAFLCAIGAAPYSCAAS